MNKLKELRKAKSLKQEDLANYLKIPIPTYCRYENEKYEMDYKTLLKLSNFFKVPINYLLGEKDENLILITKEEFDNLQTIKSLARIIDEIGKRNGR